MRDDASDNTQKQIEKSKDRIGDPNNDLLKTVDVARMLHFSESAVHQMRQSNQIPKYAMPKKLHPNQRGLYWSKQAIQRWITEIMSSDEE